MPLKLSPSSAHIWLKCPACVAESAPVPRMPPGKAADMGTANHEVAAKCLLNKCDAESYGGEVIEVPETGRTFKFTRSMAANVQTYLDVCREAAQDAIVLVEEKLAGELVNGTVDFAAARPLDHVSVKDYKNGVNPVETKDNPQMLLYLAELMRRYDAETGDIEIVQPRSKYGYVPGAIMYTREQVEAFIETAKAAAAKTKTEPTTYVPGDHCGYCPAKTVCRGLRASNKELAAQVAPAMADAFPVVTTLSGTQIAAVFKFNEQFKQFFKGVYDFALNGGVEVPGYKRVIGKKHRAWKDEVAVEEELAAELGDEVYEKKLKSPAKIEKLIGKDRVKELCYTPDGELTLVPCDTDERPEVTEFKNQGEL